MGLEVKDGPPSIEDAEELFARLREDLEPTHPGFLPMPGKIDVSGLIAAFSMPPLDEIELDENDIEIVTEG